MNHRYDIQWVGHCKFDESDKIWGWFIYGNTVPKNLDRKALIRQKQENKWVYTFWARTGKTCHFKRHHYSFFHMKKLVREKKNHKYYQISPHALQTIWPSFYDDLDTKFVFFHLAGD